MDNSFQTSFIPKKPVNPTFVNKAPVNVFLVFAMIVFFGVVVATVGLYLYKSYLITQKGVLSDSLTKISDTFEPETIKELEAFDNRTNTAKQILGKHIVLSPMFEKLGELTIPTIQFTEFGHEVINDQFYVKMSGMTKDYKSIALQADVFNSDVGKDFKNTIFSNLEKDKNNYIHFDLEFIVSPDLLSYEKHAVSVLSQVPVGTTISAVTSNTSGNTAGLKTVDNSNQAPNDIVAPGQVFQPGSSNL